MDSYKIALDLEQNNPQYLFDSGQLAKTMADYGWKNY